MASKTAIEKATKNEIVIPAGPMQIGSVEDEDRKGLAFPRLALFQGTGREQKKYPGCKPGDFIDTGTGEVIEPDTKFLAVRGWSEWIRFGDSMSDPIVYRYTSKADVPPEDLAWGEDGEPPAATKHRNWVLLFEGLPLPLVASWKKKGLKQAETFDITVAKFRGYGLFTMGTQELSSPNGDYLIMRPRISGSVDPNSDFYKEAVAWYKTLEALDATSLSEAAAGGSEAASDDTPF